MNNKSLTANHNFKMIVLLCLSAVFGVLFLVLLISSNNASIQSFYQSKIGISSSLLFGLLAIIFFSIPFFYIIQALNQIYFPRYFIILNENGNVYISNESISQFINDIVSNIPGIQNLNLSVLIKKTQKISIKIWININEKSDFVRFSERLQKKVIQELEFNFGIKNIQIFELMIESVDILSNTKLNKTRFAK